MTVVSLMHLFRVDSKMTRFESGLMKLDHPPQRAAHACDFFEKISRGEKTYS
jgi:hypothetical protein